MRLQIKLAEPIRQEGSASFILRISTAFIDIQNSHPQYKQPIQLPAVEVALSSKWRKLRGFAVIAKFQRCVFHNFLKDRIIVVLIIKTNGKGYIQD